MERGLLGRRPLLMTRDEALVEAVQRLAAVAGVELQLDAEGRGSWSSAPLVLVGSDATGGLVSMHLPRRPGVIVVGVGAPTAPPGAGLVAGDPVWRDDRVWRDDHVWRDAVAIGAEHVIALPDAEAWLIQRFGETADGPARNGRLTAVMSASGGVGVSTLAVALGVAAQESFERVIVIDGCPHGAGLDLVMGAEGAPGIRWPELVDARGRLSASALDQALPHPNGLALLSHARPHGSDVAADAAGAVLDAALRGYDRVVVDLDRADSPLHRAVLGRADDIVILIPASIRGIASGLAAIDHLQAHAGTVTPVIRCLPKGIGVRDAQEALGRRDLPTLPETPAVGSRANQGDASLPSDAYGKAVRALLGRLASPGRAHAA